jgi:hypothetical protein
LFRKYKRKYTAAFEDELERNYAGLKRTVAQNIGRGMKINIRRR